MGNDVFLEKKFNAVRHRLQDALRPDAVGSQTILDKGAHAAFGQFHNHENEKIDADDHNDFGQKNRHIEPIHTQHFFTLSAWACRYRPI